MILPSFATQTVTVWRAPLIIDHSSQVRDWSKDSDGDYANAASHDVGGCSVQPGGGTVDWINRTSVTTLCTVYAPAGADVADGDRIEFGGVVYALDGPVRIWQTGVLDHIEIALKAVAG